MQHITERDRIKQRIIRVEVTFHLLSKCPVRENWEPIPYARFGVADSETVRGRENRALTETGVLPMAFLLHQVVRKRLTPKSVTTCAVQRLHDYVGGLCTKGAKYYMSRTDPKRIKPV